MTKNIDRRNSVNGIETFQIKDTTHSRPSVTRRPNETVILQLDHREITLANLRVCSANFGDCQRQVRRDCRDIADIFCVQDKIQENFSQNDYWGKQRSRSYSGQHILKGLEGTGIFFVREMGSRVKSRMAVIKILVKGIVISVILNP